MLHEQLSHQIISCFYDVYNILGYGFLERIYENALCIELRRRGLECRQQVQIDVLYTGEIVGDYCADILVNETIILELKAAKMLTEEHDAQLLNYLKATQIEVGLLFNFGKKPEFIRKVFSNSYKSALRHFVPPNGF